MHVPKFSLSNLLIKIVIFTFFFYIAILSISILITGYLFISLDSYKNRIENIVFKHTGYKLSVESIKTKLNNYYLPEIVIKNAMLINPKNSKQNFGVKSLEFVFSYSSIWNFEPIFDQINIDGTTVNLEYLIDGSIIVNGINLNHPDQKTLENTKNSPIDLENWILKQKRIKLSNINLSFDDKHNNFPILKLQNITTKLVNGYNKKHNFSLSLNTAGEKKSSVIAKLNWVGGKISEYDKWQSAELKLQSYTGNNNVTGTIKQYLSGIDFLQEFNAETALEAQIKNGKLQYFYANFDLKNLQYALKHNTDFIKFPKLGGNIRITLVNDSSYKLEASNLTISTPDGYIFNNKDILGSYNIGVGGQISLESTDLKAFNNILPLFPDADGLSFSGTIEIIKLDWIGKLLKPTNYDIFAKFHNLGISSKQEKFPSINGISGDIQLSRDHGIMNLVLDNSTLIYKSVFLIPYKFKHLDTQITWRQLNSKTESGNVEVNLGKINLQMADFSAVLSGKYTYIPGTSGYLSLKAHVNKVLTSKVGDYLPIQIGMPVHVWLNNGLIGGYGVNADLDLDGPLEKFPFESGGGRFYIDADIQDAQLLYVKDWPTLDNLYGKFKIRNVAIIIEASSGKIYGNNINKAEVTIPNMSAHDVYLVADGIASGTTPNFMNYLQKTPINDLIGNIPDKLSSIGNGQVSIHLKVPFDNPNKTTVAGDYNFISNSLKFNLPIPELNDTSGVLYFTEKGIKIDKIRASALDSNAELSANTEANGTMHFTVHSPNLDYTKLSKFYLPYLSSLIKGRSNTLINFDIGSHGINNISAKSDLQGVGIDAPQPLHKESQSISQMNFSILNNNPGFNISFNYADLINGKVLLDAHGNMSKTNLAIGTKGYLSTTSNNPKILINSKLTDTYVLDWLQTITKITQDNNSKSEFGSTTNKPILVKESENHNNIYPLELLLDTPHFYVGDTDYKKANLDVLVNNKYAVFAINNSQTNGYGKFDFINNHLDIMINDFHYYQAVINMRDSQSMPFAVKINNTLAANPNFKIINEIQQNFNTLKNESASAGTNLKLPIAHIMVDKFWYENQQLGKLSANLYPNNRDLILESGVLLGPDSKLDFSGVNYCMECGAERAFVDMQTKWSIKNLGALLDNIGLKNTISAGNGMINASIQWGGRFQDFDITRTIATINVDLKDGKFLKIDTTSGILNQLIGIMNLQYLFNFVNLGFANTLQNGFAFNTLTMHAYLINNKIQIKDLDIFSASGSVKSYGVVDLQNETINMYMSVTPHLSTGVAVGVGVATLNPIVGLITYGAELLLGSPVNKLFTVSFHISGSLLNPNVEQIGISKQVVNNVNSTVGVGEKNGQ